MLETFIKILFLLTTSIYTFYKISNSKPVNRTTQLLLGFTAILTCIVITFLFGRYHFIIPVVFISFFLIIKIFRKQSTALTYTTTLFSFAFNYVIFYFSSFSLSLIFLVFYYKNIIFSWPIIHICVGLLHTLFIYCCFHIPRLQKGMTFLYNLPAGNMGFTICVTIIMSLILVNQTENRNDYFLLFFFTLLLLSGFLLIYWWNYHITQTYRKYLKKNEIDSLNLLLEERNQEILYLRSENDKLARIIHKDNKLIPALSMAIIDSYENGTKLDLSALDSDSSLHRKLKQLYEERVEILANYEKELIHLPQTSFDSVNAVLSYMYTEALKSKIPYQIILFDDLTSTIPAKITEDDFTHILSDLLTNAINACQNIESAFIQIYLGEINGISTIKIYNTGKLFDIETLKNLGLARHTTHANTGGSGIGLMDIWRLKEKYKATLLIDEITKETTPSSYTCFHILLNQKGHYIIQSDRHKELSTYINRPDIMILSKE